MNKHAFPPTGSAVARLGCMLQYYKSKTFKGEQLASPQVILRDKLRVTVVLDDLSCVEARDQSDSVNFNFTGRRVNSRYRFRGNLVAKLYDKVVFIAFMLVFPFLISGYLSSYLSIK